MRVLPIRYVDDVAACARFYAALGLTVSDVARHGNWVELDAASGALALHAAADEEPSCQLAFEAHEPLEAVRRRLLDAGYAPSPVMDESHGWSFRVTDPDGVVVQVNEFDRELYT